MDIPEDVAAIEVLARRRDFLSYLDGEPAEKPAMVEDLDHSRSTVDRAIRALEDAGFVDRTADGYVTTLTGRLAMDRYESFLEESESILDGQSVLNALPSSFDLPASFVSSATTELVENRHQLFEALAADLTRADSYRAMVPQIADSRYVRLFHSRIEQDDLDMQIVSRPDVFEKVGREFPHLSADLATASSFTALESETPDAGLVLIATDDRTTAIVVAYERGAPVGVIRTSDDAAVSWAQTVFDEHVSDATETDALDADNPTAIVQLDDQRLPATLRTQGFVLVDGTYFESRTAIDPVTAWRAGLQLPEIAAGYAVERISGDGDRSLSDSLFETLVSGTDVALVGPPGSGKSTVCKQVAYAWFDEQRGPVLYRESASGRPFEDIGALEAILDRSDGHALVVVEDAVRAGANAVFDVMQALRGRSDVTFLLDAREREWEDPAELPIDARTEAFRRNHVETVTMPSLDATDSRRIRERFEEITGSEYSVPGTLTDDVPAESASRGEAFLLFHRLARSATPPGEAAGPTTLEEHVGRVRETLAQLGEDALDVGVLVNVLNAAGIAVTPVALHAVAAGSDADHATVRAAIDALDGEVLFGLDGDQYHTVHDSWSVEFLDSLLEADETASDRFDRVLTALLSLADDAERRATVAGVVSDGERRLGEIAAEPTVWADDIAGQVFELGASYPRLAALFGTTAESSLVLPDAVSRETVLKQSIKRGEMHRIAGNYETARREFERVGESIDDSSAPRGDDAGLYGWAMLGLSQIEHATESEDALEYARTALATFESIEDDTGIAKTTLWLVQLLIHRGEFEAAETHIEDALDLARDLGDRRVESSALLLRAYLLGQLGDLDASRRVLDDCLSLAQEAGATETAMKATGELARICRLNGDLREAERYGRQSLDLSRRRGGLNRRISMRLLLGQCAIDRSRIEEARDHLEAAAEHSDRLSVKRRVGTKIARARLARIRGDYETSRELLEAVLDLGLEQTGARTLTGCRFHLARTHLAADDVEAARAQAEQAVELATELDNAELVARSRAVRGRVALAAGNDERASEELEMAREHSESTEMPIHTARIEHALGDLSSRNGDEAQARQHYESALETFRDAGAARFAFEVIEDLAEIDSAEWYAVGAEIAADAGREEYAAELRQRAAEAGDDRQARTD